MGKKKSLPIGIALTLLFGPFGLFYSLGRKKIKLTLVLIFIWALFLPMDGDPSVVIPMNLIPVVIGIAGLIGHNRQVESEANKDDKNSNVGSLHYRKTRTTRPFRTPTEPDSLSPNMSGISPTKRLTAPRSQFSPGKSNSTYSYSEPPLDPYTESDHSEAYHEADLGHDYDSPYHDIDLIDLDYDDLVPEGAEWRDPDDDPVDR